MDDRRLSMREAAFQAVNLREISAPIPVCMDDASNLATQSVSTPDVVTASPINGSASNRKRTQRLEPPHGRTANSAPALKRPRKLGRGHDTEVRAGHVDFDHGVGGGSHAKVVQPVTNTAPTPVDRGVKNQDTERKEATAIPIAVVDDGSAGVADVIGVAPTKQALPTSVSEVGNPSAETNGADEDMLVRTYGMFRLQAAPVPGDDGRWLGCNFCHKFPSKKSKKFFLLSRTPYREGAINKHIVKIHNKQWTEFSQKSEAEKKDFFSDVTYPSAEILEKRAKDLMKSWQACDVLGKVRGNNSVKPNGKGRGKGKKEGVGKKDSVSGKDKSGMKGKEGNEGSNQAKSTNVGAATPMLIEARKASSEECLAGRKLHHGERLSQKEFEIAMQKEGIGKRASGLGGAFLPSNLLDCFEEIGMVHSDVADLVLEGVLSEKDLRAEGSPRGLIFPPSITANGDTAVKVNKENILPSGKAKMQRLAAFTLFHMLRGITPSVTVSLCQYVGNCAEATENSTTTMEHNVNQKLNVTEGNGIDSRAGVKKAAFQDMSATDAKDQWAEKFRNELGEFVNEGERLIWNSSNSICAQALYLLRKLLSENELNRTLIIATRKCEEHGEGGVEFLLRVRKENRRAIWAHLLSVRYRNGAADSLISVLNCVAADWRKQLVGVRSGLHEADSQEKDLEHAIVRRLQQATDIGDSFAYISRKEVPFLQMSLRLSESEPQTEIIAKGDPATQQSPNQTEADVSAFERNAAAKIRSNAKAEVEVKNDLQSKVAVVSRGKPVRMLSPQNAVLTVSLPSSGDALSRERLNLFGKRNTEAASSKAVDPALERVMWARALVSLHTMNKNDKTAPSYRRKGNSQNPAPHAARISQAWGLNWSNCDAAGGTQLTAGLGSREAHAKISRHHRL